MLSSARTPLKVNIFDSLVALIGGFSSIAILSYLTQLTDTLWLMAPFGASCVLAFGIWNAPFSQPRNIIGGHLISTCIGITAYKLFGSDPWVLALAVGLAIACMMLSKTTHPPAGADPIVVILAGSSWDYLITPVLTGAIIIVVVALLVNNLQKDRKYPTFWL
ncbi:HPP family protein [Bacillus pseudomycoides]|uniref:HPP family protein n=1 Tax=Bacillus bingmayongensis TaxID=1150157 RepID=A0ABU5JX01_9BACI|nr:HPP family protein [Bacillus pseudomycoides]